MTGVELSAEQRAAWRENAEDRTPLATHRHNERILRLLDALDAAEARVAAVEAEREPREWRPEDGDHRCQRCGHPNPMWFIENDLWNRVTGTPDNPRGEGIVLCRGCFHQQRAQAAEAEVARLRDALSGAAHAPGPSDNIHGHNGSCVKCLRAKVARLTADHPRDVAEAYMLGHRDGSTVTMKALGVPFFSKESMKVTDLIDREFQNPYANDDYETFSDEFRKLVTENRRLSALVEAGLALADEWIGMGCMRSMDATTTAKRGHELRAVLGGTE